MYRDHLNPKEKVKRLTDYMPREAHREDAFWKALGFFGSAMFCAFAAWTFFF